MGNCRVGVSDILSLTKIDIVFHLPLKHLQAQISVSPSLEVSLSPTCIIRHQGFRVDAGWHRGGLLFKITTNTYRWQFQGLFNGVEGIRDD